MQHGYACFTCSVKSFFFFFGACLCCPTPVWVFFNVFFFNFLRLHQCENWQIDLPINGNIF